MAPSAILTGKKAQGRDTGHGHHDLEQDQPNHSTNHGAAGDLPVHAGRFF